MRFLITLLLSSSISTLVLAEDFNEMCSVDKETDGKESLSLFHCGESGLPDNIQKIFSVSEAIGDLNCKKYLMKARRVKEKDLDKDLLIFDKKNKKSRPLRCYCQEKSGLGLCKNPDHFNKSLESLKEPFQIKAWAVFAKDLLRVSSVNGGSCIDKLEDNLGKKGCLEKLDEVQKVASRHMEFPGKDGKILKEDSLDKFFGAVRKHSKTGKGMIREPMSQFYKSNLAGNFKSKFKIKEDSQFWGKSTTEYNAKLKELGLYKHVEEFREILMSNDPEKKLRESTSLGINIFSVQEGIEGEEVDRVVALASHPDLKFMFSGILEFSEADRRKQREKLLRLSELMKENEFADFKELRKLYENKYLKGCDELIKTSELICSNDTANNLAITKELVRENLMEGILGFSGGDREEEEIRFIKKAVDDISCFEFPEKYIGTSNEFTELIGRNLESKSMFDMGTEIPRIEAEVDTAIARVQGMEDVARRIEKVKAEGKSPEEGERLDKRFREYLSNLELPSGQNFSYSGGDIYEGINAYKKEVYNWADSEVESRLSDIQGETESIVNSDLPPAVKKAKLERLMNEVQRLNDGDFLKEIFEQKQSIADQIAKYEDEKENWDAQYAEEAMRDPKAVQAVAPPRDQTRVAGGGSRGTNSYKSVGSPGTVSAAPGTAASASESVAYIPPRPSVPYAQGSMLTRIVPKDEFKDSTVKASLLARHKGYPIAVLDEKALKVELYTPEEGTSYKLQETLTISEAEARGYVFPEDVKKLVEGYKKDKKKGRAPASFIEYEPTAKELKEKKKKLSKLQSMADVMERQGVPRRARVVRLNQILDNI